jgi:A/G-specific adenine glycosylase
MDYGAMLKKKYDDPSRKSAHYKTQSPFIGSTRQVRGAILRLLLKDPGIGEKEIRDKLESVNGTDVGKVLDDLKKEGLLSSKKGRFTIA